jgi:class 3 adenylate cyclase
MATVVSWPSAGRDHGGVPVPGSGARKTVTILFTDLVDSSRLSRTLDPEALWNLLTRYFEAMSAVVQKHGGTVEKYIGDAIMAVFEVPTLHEDDFLRASSSC